jgi:hypothetical protein
MLAACRARSARLTRHIAAYTQLQVNLERESVSSKDIQVINNEAAHRFEVVEDDHLAELDYQRQGNRIIFTHTGVPAALEGRGIGGALVKAGLEYARSNELQVVPLCPFVRSYIERKPEYQPLVNAATSGGFG